MSDGFLISGAYRIARTVQFQSWRGTNTARFEREDGWYLCEVWFEDCKPKMQLRSLTFSLQEAHEVTVAVGMAIAWAMGELPQVLAHQAKQQGAGQVPR